MGTIIKFPAAASARRLGMSMEVTPGAQSATIVILPVVRIERQTDGSRGDGSGPEEGTAPGRRRRRRARS